MTKPAHNAAVPSTEPRLRAALKWAGGKYSILPKLLAVFPDAPRFIEPFLGSAVVSLNTNYSSYILSDNNPDLVAFYRHLRRKGTPSSKPVKLLFRKYQFARSLRKVPRAI